MPAQDPDGRSGTKWVLQSSEAQNPFLGSYLEHHPFLGIQNFQNPNPSEMVRVGKGGGGSG